MEHLPPDHGFKYMEDIAKKSRRDMMFKAGAALNVVAGVLLGIPLVGFVFSSFVKRDKSQAWINLGKLDQYPERQTRMATYRNPFTTPWDGTTADIPCWVRRVQGKEFQVFAVNCAHLGCPVRWFQESGLFMCPCHGGVYYEDGERAAGPPPRGLFKYETKIENGQLYVRGGQMPTLAEPV